MIYFYCHSGLIEKMVIDVHRTIKIADGKELKLSSVLGLLLFLGLIGVIYLI